MEDSCCAKAAKQTKVEELIDMTRFLNDNVSGLRNRLYSACERIGVQFDPEPTDDVKSPPPFGSLYQLHEEIAKVGRIVDDASQLMNRLESFI